MQELIMVNTTIKFADKTLALSPIPIGENASMTDFTNPKTEIIIIKCTEEGGEIWISKSGLTIEQGDIRVVESQDVRLEKIFTDNYERKIKTKFGDAMLVFSVS